jgi:hypothetical protein
VDAYGDAIPEHSASVSADESLGDGKSGAQSWIRGAFEVRGLHQSVARPAIGCGYSGMVQRREGAKDWKSMNCTTFLGTQALYGCSHR